MTRDTTENVPTARTQPNQTPRRRENRPIESIRTTRRRARERRRAETFGTVRFQRARRALNFLGNQVNPDTSDIPSLCPPAA